MDELTLHLTIVARKQDLRDLLPRLCDTMFEAHRLYPDGPPPVLRRGGSRTRERRGG